MSKLSDLTQAKLLFKQNSKEKKLHLGPAKLHHHFISDFFDVRKDVEFKGNCLISSEILKMCQKLSEKCRNLSELTKPKLLFKQNSREKKLHLGPTKLHHHFISDFFDIKKDVEFKGNWRISSEILKMCQKLPGIRWLKCQKSRGEFWGDLYLGNFLSPLLSSQPLWCTIFQKHPLHFRYVSQFSQLLKFLFLHFKHI